MLRTTALRHLFQVFPAGDPEENPARAETPSLEAFRDRHDPQGVLGEADLLAAYRDAYGASEGAPAATGKAGKHERAARLRRRQREALAWLESRLVQAPQRDHPVAAWFDEEVAARLAAGGVDTVYQLVERINGLGPRWWSGVPGIGRATGTRLHAWVSENAPALGVTLGAQTTVPRSRLDVSALLADSPRLTAIVPLERFRVPAALDGSQGRFRAPQAQCLLAATNDYAALLAWLASKRPAAGEGSGPQRLTHTQRAYRKEAERFLLWAILERKTPLSSIAVEDCAAYRNFLADPQPARLWCAPRSRERWSALWRPFEGPLAPASERQALTILANLYEWLMRNRYLVGNPWSAVAPREDRAGPIQTGRSFTTRQWAHLLNAVERLPETGRRRRLAFVLRFAYATGLRLSELAAARLADLQCVELEEGETGWMLQVLGKGGRRREVPLPDPVMGTLAEYLRARGLDPALNAADPEAYLIGKIDDAAARLPGRPAFDPREGVAAATLAADLKRFFVQAARALGREERKGAAARLERASAHWLLHTHGSHAVAANVPIEVVQNNLGHASLSTTTMYVTSEKRRRYREMAKFLAGG